MRTGKCGSRATRLTLRLLSREREFAPSFSHRFIEYFFKLSVRSAEPGNNFLAPIDILPSSLQIPTVGWIIGHIADVADLVTELDLLRGLRKMRSLLDLLL